jgi:hypothetical protein
MGSKGVAADGIPDIGSNVDSHISALLSTTSNNGLDLEPSNKQRDDDFGGLNLAEALETNQQCSSSHVQKYLDHNERSEHLHDHAPICL